MEQLEKQITANSAKVSQKLLQFFIDFDNKTKAVIDFLFGELPVDPKMFDIALQRFQDFKFWTTAAFHEGEKKVSQENKEEVKQ